MRRVIGGVATLLLTLALPAAAGDNGFFVGGGIGQATLELSQLDDELGQLDFSDDNTAYKLFVGYRVLSFFALQAEYLNFGTAKDIIGPGFDVQAEVDLSSLNAYAMGFLPMGPIDLFAKLGVASWDADIKATLDDISAAASEDGTDLAYGLGVGLQLGPISVRGEVEYFEVRDADDVYLVSLSALYTF